MKILEIPDDSGFMGIINVHRYDSHVGKDWDFEDIQQRVIQQTNLNNIAFWSTGSEGIWKVLLNENKSDKIASKEQRSVIEVTHNRLYLINYESLTMAAAYKDVNLPEDHLSELYYELENGKYMLTIRQIGEEKNTQSIDKVDFEIVFQRITNFPELYKNKVENIYWF